MAKTNKWSEQCLVENTFAHTDENGNEVKKTLNCLEVCLTGKELYAREFIGGKYKGKDQLIVPFDFIVTFSGSLSPRGGRFYEMEYTMSEDGLGTVYRALIQAINPVADLQLILGVLKGQNILPKNLKSRRAWLRDDIQVVNIGHCLKDDNGEAVFYSRHIEAKDGELSLTDYAVKHALTGCCFDYYRGDVREVWVPETCDCSQDKVFVCGVNGDDPEFAERKAEDMDRLSDLIHEAMEIIDDYNVPHFLLIDQGGDNLLKRFHVSTNIKLDKMHKIIDAMKEHSDNPENA